MGKVGRDRWRSSSPNPLLKQSPREHIILDCVQAAFYYLQARRLLNLSGQPTPPRTIWDADFWNLLSSSQETRLTRKDLLTLLFPKQIFLSCHGSGWC